MLVIPGRGAVKMTFSFLQLLFAVRPENKMVRQIE